MLELIIVSLIQGITEPLPISSSGHLQIVSYFLNVSDDSLALEVLTNFGSFLAIVFLYQKYLAKIFKNTYLFARTKEKKYYGDFKYFMYVAIATVPAGIVGLLFEDLIEKYLLNPKVTGIMLLVTGVMLFLIRKMEGKLSVKKLGIKEVLLIGGFQAIALIPGISRSGSTIVGASLVKLSRKEAFNFAFLLYIPISVAVLIGKLDDILQLSFSFIIVGITIAFFATLFATKLFYRIVSRGKLVYFSIYCFLIGTLTLILL